MGIGHHRGCNSEEQPPGGDLGRGRGNSVDVVWLKLSPQQAGLRGDGRDWPWCPCREVLHEPAGWDSLLLMQHVALAFHNPAPAPHAARHALAASLRLSLGIKCCLLPAQHLAPHSGSSRAPPSVPQPTLPSGLLSVWVQPQEASLQASQHCRNQDAVVGLMFHERQELIIFQAQKNPEHLWLRPAIARIQRPCPKPAAVSVPSLGGSSFLSSPWLLGGKVKARKLQGWQPGLGGGRSTGRGLTCKDKAAIGH